MRPLALGLLLASCLAAGIVEDVRAAAARGDFAAAESAIAAYRKSAGTTPDAVLAQSWLARGALNARAFDRAETYAAETRRQALDLLKQRRLDDEPKLPLALGASIEVHAQALAARGQRSEAVAFLNEEIQRWRGTSIVMRTRKNINLLSLEGKPAPALESAGHLGPAVPSLRSLKGRPVLLFFWAHWCGDCKAEMPVIARIAHEFGAQGLALLAPTQRYGYIARGEDASPQQEIRYIEEVRRKFYAPLAALPTPVSEANFRNYGASTTPTLVLIDAGGIVRMFHPGAMSYEDLAARIRAVMPS